MVDSNLITQPVPESLESEPLELQKGLVEIWTTSLDVAPEIQAEFQNVLSPVEIDRAERFRFAIHRQRYISARAVMRIVLSRYLDAAPEELEFEYGLHGKPTLAANFSPEDLHFNLSHCDGLAVLAVTQEAPLGVDVEKVRELNEFDQLVNRFFSSREAERFSRLSKAQKPAAFFNLWTRKESWLKATGEGIANRLKEVEVSFLEDEPIRFLALPEDEPGGAGGRTNWQLYDLTSAPGYKAALAIAGPEVLIRNRCWVDSMASKARRTP